MREFTNWENYSHQVEINEIVAIATSLGLPETGMPISEFTMAITEDIELCHQIEMIEVKR